MSGNDSTGNQHGPTADHSLLTTHHSPKWYEDAVFYALPVKAFADGNHDGVGDFAGLTDKLDYFVELGVSCLWLLPFQPSPLRDDGYDVADYRDVHPRHGTVADFRTFLQAAHERGLRVVAEMPVNHTSIDHPWFQAARAAQPGSPLRDFYIWRDTPETPREVGVDGRTRWTWDPVARAYYWHRSFDHQPDLNYFNPAVGEEMGRVLRFWLELGVDGLALNGASFLAGPDENRPETHTVLAALRAQMEGDYPDRMLQAGLNQWPTDAAAYLGARGCHMVPNLPLAQRLFLALRQEDRHGLTDILKQTPMPPAGCQWVTLLRNHDELTLTLATDEERDYMYREYAADPGLRAGLGIIRRLAPLVDNSRPRIELLFGLLFALPGAPVLYYGDEIGMGDNPALRDRDAVRTPMQWSADRNAGFSRADFARLYCPPVMDPVHGYQAVNVEAQRRDPSSLLHAVRRLIALRRRHPAFARGSLELLEPANRKVFACLRRLGDETLLVVANLARTAQPVELDLSALMGLVPVELAGRTPFPVIGLVPYPLTLGPHALLWFSLQKHIEDVAARLAPVQVEEPGAPPIIELEGPWPTLLEGPALRTLEKRVLPSFLHAQRWFGGKARAIEAVRLVDHGPLLANSWLALFEVVSTGGADLYHLPLSISTGENARRVSEGQTGQVLARLRGPGGEAVLYDALADDTFCAALLDAMGRGTEWQTRRGVVRGIPTSAYVELRGGADRSLRAVRGPATSSNTLVFYGRRLLLKLFRRLEVGINPDFEVGRFLTEREQFERIPPVAGALEYRPSSSSGPVTMALLQALVPNQGDGWQHAIEELGRYFERAWARLAGGERLRPDKRRPMDLTAVDPPPAALEVIGSYLHAAATLGQRTAEMHMALATGESAHDPDFTPEPFTTADLAALSSRVVRQGHQALDALRDNLAKLSGVAEAAGRQLLAEGAAALERLARPPADAPHALKTRVHGDYHLGQVLWVDNDFIILDFEGEPTRTVQERRARQSPLKDVAGMLRSFDYAAFAGLFAFTHERPDDFTRLEPWARLWQQWVSATFLRAYRARAGAAPFLPDRPGAFAALLDRFLLDKAFYELVYELNNRPDWVRIPLSGILTLIGERAL